MDERQASIVFQNAMAHATTILIHNSQGSVVDPKDVVELALKIARVGINPIPHMNKQKEDQK